VNQWRAAKGVAPLQYSTQLQNAAQARISDMEQYRYYGHTNPVTKQDNGYFTQKYDPSATWWDEVLDGPNNASQALPDFKNSPEHYAALTDARENYIGVASVYYPESWNDYDNNGKLQTTSDTVILNGKTETVTTPVSGDGTCIVVGQLADKVGQAPQGKPAQPVQNSMGRPSIDTSYAPIPTVSYAPTHSDTCSTLDERQISVLQNAENAAYNTAQYALSNDYQEYRYDPTQYYTAAQVDEDVKTNSLNSAWSVYTSAMANSNCPIDETLKPQ
jgi:hypothetical protein